MALAIVYSRASVGIAAPLVTVEAHLSNGMAGFHIVGLPEAAVRESKDRVRSALVNSNFEFPIRHITINLAPADLPKEGGRFDLPIALGILAASGQIPQDGLAAYEFAGELALSGELRSIKGVLPLVLAAQQAGRQLIIPHVNCREAVLVKKAQVWPAQHLLEVCAHLRGQSLPQNEWPSQLSASKTLLDLAEVKGQSHAKRALEVAAAGSHSLLFVGPPGTGKTMLASRLIGLLPPLSEVDALEVATIASVSHQGFDFHRFKQMPFRAPHHTSSSAALVGGGRPPKPGEISLAHRGVLFLDELPEFGRHVLECLREPLESGSITLSRAAFQMCYPAKFQLIAAMNPCPCGYAGSMTVQCQCSHDQVKRYMSKISGPLLDRIDMQVDVPQLSPDVLLQANSQQTESSERVRQRVLIARDCQLARQGKLNTALTNADMDEYGNLKSDALDLLKEAMSKFNLSARVYHRIVKVARTIADLAGAETIEGMHLSEALSYRCFDKVKI